MPGRKPIHVEVFPEDLPALEQMIRRQTAPAFHVRRARTILEASRGERVQDIAARVACDPRTVRRTCLRYEQGGLNALFGAIQRSGRPREISPLQRAQIVELACLEPIAQGLHITHWSSDDLAREAIREGIVQRISPRTIRRILNEVDLQPHRTRYWKTSKIDPQFKERAAKVLWCYAHAQRLAEADRWVVCVDEVPNFQILQRPIRRARPGMIERQEYEYTRHGVATMLFFLIVHTGEMKLAILESKNAATFIEQSKRFRDEHSDLRRVFLILDGDSSHTAGATSDYLAQDDWWCPRRTPVHASWLDQAEILIHMFKSRYLARQSWACREDFLTHVNAAWPEYNERYAHPINWTWTDAKMREWYNKHHD